MIDIQAIKHRLNRIGLDGRGIDVQRMADLTGKSTKTIRRYLDPADHTEPSLTFVTAVCVEYGVSMDMLVMSGGVMVDVGVEERWSRTVSWWTHNLPAPQKDLLMALCATVWESALFAGSANPNLIKETGNRITRKLPKKSRAK